MTQEERVITGLWVGLMKTVKTAGEGEVVTELPLGKALKKAFSQLIE